jgi:hypothetical protein
MVYLLYKALEHAGCLEWFPITVTALLIWCTVMKLAKLIPHFEKHPKDLIYFPGYLIFGYVSSFLRIYAMFTFMEGQWKIEPTEVPGAAAAALVEDTKQNGVQFAGGYLIE